MSIIIYICSNETSDVMNTYVPVDFSSDSAADDIDSYVKSDDVIDRNDDDAELYDGHPKVCGMENLQRQWMLVHILDMNTSDSLIHHGIGENLVPWGK